ncbi:MAG: Stf0 family sulfotransferase, partial [Pseudomonadota bacterium]
MSASGRALILCSSPRSGSTLLCRLLEATGVAGAPESWFHRPDAFDWLRGLGLTAPDGATEREAAALAFEGARAAGTRGGVFGLRL